MSIIFKLSFLLTCAHLSGYTGYFLQRDFGKKLGRITGLDPAKPYFEFTHPIVRLDPSDAKFVDIVHTDSGFFIHNSFGIKQEIGHLDFYLNDGENQPSCKNTSISDITCHHAKSIDYFIESINTKCKFTAISCNSYEEFSKGKCNCGANNKNCFTFGFHSYKIYQKNLNISENEIFEFPKIDKKPKAKVFLNTAENSPFCQSHARISVKMSNQYETDIGILKISFIGNESKSEKIQVNKKIENFEKGKTKIYLVNFSYFDEEIKSMKVHYFYSLDEIRIFKPEIFVEFIEIESFDDGKYYKMCSLNRRPLKSYEVYEFKESFCDDEFENIVIN
ncbi:hypothetical protein PVAND_016966 [Polypedilum vanderplanki]|uniref:Lipase domain-containing protein n=1 Tax=Polypedilum vanderplanki TaxID=319348 RepID=A0A9J6BH82_POLVA|nr:hypothetical protein PVAND_016966 [Polypedilum vanderplanki]